MEKQREILIPCDIYTAWGGRANIVAYLRSGADKQDAKIKELQINIEKLEKENKEFKGKLDRTRIERNIFMKALEKIERQAHNAFPRWLKDQCNIAWKEVKHEQ